MRFRHCARPRVFQVDPTDERITTVDVPVGDGDVKIFDSCGGIILMHAISPHSIARILRTLGHDESLLSDYPLALRVPFEP